MAGLRTGNPVIGVTPARVVARHLVLAAREFGVSQRVPQFDAIRGPVQPFAQRGERPTLVAAPIPSPARYGGKPVYFTDIVVRAVMTLSDVRSRHARSRSTGYRRDDP